MRHNWVLTIFIALVLQLSVSTVFADDETLASGSARPIEYNLPDPGILPDHPLYFFKVARDRIAVYFITDPQEKVTFFLKQADTGISAAATLVDKQNIKLAQTTALKAEHNMTLLSLELSNFEKFPAPALLNTLSTASHKHQEVLAQVLDRVPEGERGVFQQVIDFSKRNHDQITSLMPPKINEKQP